MPATHYRACNLCEAMCGVRIDVDGGVVTRIAGDDDDPFSKGYVCPKAVALKDLHEDPERLRRPLVKRAGRFVEVGWDEALDEAARGLVSVQKTHGLDAVAAYLGNPSVHNTGAMLFGPTFLRALKSKNRFSATSVDQLPSMLVAHWMFGHQLLLPIPDVDRTDYFLVLGANPLASNGSLMTAPGMRWRLDALRARGGKLVVIDPRRTETAERADRHVFIRPGTDALVLAAIVREALAAGPSLGRLAAFTDGLEPLARAVEPFSPERVAKPSGVDAATIRAIAGELWAAKRAVVYGRMGTCTQELGALCQWLVNALNVITGNLDRPGGAMFTRPAIDPLTLPKGLGASRGGFARYRSRVRGLPEFSGELPVAALAEEILVDGPGRVRALVTLAGNPVLSTPNGRRLDEALATLDCMVSIDPYLNETTRHATVILPPPSALERGHYDLVFHTLAVRNTARYAPALFDPGADARHDWQILSGLTRRIEDLRDGESPLRTLKHKALERLGPEGMLEIALRLGPYGAKLRPLRKGLGLDTLRANVHGLDFGALEPCLPDRLFTRTKRIDLAPRALLDDLPRALALLDTGGAAQSDELALIGRRHLRDNNSWMHNVKRLLGGPKRCTAMLHPDDAARLGLATGDVARFQSRVGAIELPIEVTAAMMPGVVSVPHGYGHGRDGTRLTTANAHAGASINDLTDETALDALSGNAALSGVRVRVAKISKASEPASS